MLPATGRLAVEELYARARQTYGAERVTEQGMLALLRRVVSEGRCGYAETAESLIQSGAAVAALAGYVGKPELPPPDTRIIRLRGTITPMEMANVMKTAMNLSRRMASSPYALWKSLESLRAKIVAGPGRRDSLLQSEVEHDGNWAEWEDLAEHERWQREAQAEATIAALFSKRAALCDAPGPAGGIRHESRGCV